MRTSNPFHKTAWVLVVSVVFLLAGSSAAQNQSVIPLNSLEGLRVSISLGQFATPSHPSFRVELQNTGEGDLLLNLGRMASTGTKEYATAISLVLVSPDGTSLRLEHISARDDDQAGENPLLLPLPSGATFSIPVDLENYRVAGHGDSRYVLTSGTYSIRAEFAGSGITSSSENPRLPFPSAGPRTSLEQMPVPTSERPFDRVTVNSSNGSLISNVLKFQVANRS